MDKPAHEHNPAADAEDERRLSDHLGRIRHKVVVLSGKGGVGKSTVAVNIAVALALDGKRVGLLDTDFHGPSIPTMLGLEKAQPAGCEDGLMPVEIGGLKVMSIGFLLPNQDDAVIWRGPMKMGVIKQFLRDVAWGDLDFLIIDSPPGTGDEPLSICQVIGKLDGAVVVTTPQKVSAVDVRKSISFCRRLDLSVIGVVENMAGFVCPKCGEVTSILPQGGGSRIASDMGVPFLGSIPMDPQIAVACDEGTAFIQRFAKTPTAKIMMSIIAPVLALDTTTILPSHPETSSYLENKNMRIAIPIADGKLAMHFGHCASFALIDVDKAQKKILKRSDVDAPPHQPGLLPPWLAERGTNMIIAGGMGSRARELFLSRGIEVIIGASAESPENIVTEFMNGSLKTGDNVCDH